MAKRKGITGQIMIYKTLTTYKIKDRETRTQQKDSDEFKCISI